MSQPKILAFTGSTRNDSLNKSLLVLAVKAASAAGAEVTRVDLKELNIPLYDGELEQSKGIPEGAQRLYHWLKSHDAILIASPEYNGSVSGTLKNAIDWSSRPQSGDPHLAGFKNKVVGLLSASPGDLGGFHGLVHLRDILGYIGAIVLPEQVIVPRAHEALDESGALINARSFAMLETLVEALISTTAKLKAEGR